MRKLSFLTALCFLAGVAANNVFAQRTTHRPRVGRQSASTQANCFDSSDPTEIRLWEGRAPGAIGDDPCRDIPYLKRYTPEPHSSATRTAIIIMPDGGYDRLTDKKEQAPVGEYFSAAWSYSTGRLVTNQQRKQKRPAPFAPGTGLFRYSDAILNIGMLEPQAQNKPLTAPRTGNGDRTSIGRSIRQSLARRLSGSAREDNVDVAPVLRVDHPRGLNFIRRTVSAPTTVADLIGDLAALHHRFARGRVASGFCHSE
jgi:hypothetical protein